MVLSGPALADDDDDDDDDDHDEAREAVKRGDALPLEKILPVVKEAVPGKVLGLKIEHDDGRLVYEFKVLTPAGAYYEIEVDARTGKVLDIERK